MTTVLNPGSSETTIYNRSGTTIVSVAAGTIPNPNPIIGNGGSVIPVNSGITVALLSPPSSWNGSDQLVVTFPTNTEVGDIMEIYSVAGFYTGSVPARAISLFPAIGESFDEQDVSTGTNTGAGSGAAPGVGIVFRKVSATNWQSIG